ncbi:hypothetical protein BDZ45DRAFT_586806, partial [Acephala macrosclerotiorum]
PKATLTSYGVIELVERRYFFDIPPETLLDKSKASITGKTLVCIQILWMTAQCIARKAAGYPLTLLEVHTVVHVVCALGLYGFWFSKPLDVTEPTIIDTSMCTEIIAHMVGSCNEPKIRGNLPPRFYIGTKAYYINSSLEISASDFPHWGRAGTSCPTKFDVDVRVRRVLILVLPALYAAIHLSAWKIEFPSRVESLLWKVSCFDLAATSILAFLLFGLLQQFENYSIDILERLTSFALGILALAYILSRFYIVIEAFISLRHVPIGAYATIPWSQNIPHI